MYPVVYDLREGAASWYSSCSLPVKIDIGPGDNPSRLRGIPRDLNGIVFIRDIQRTERPRSQTRPIYICHIGQRILSSTKYLLE